MKTIARCDKLWNKKSRETRRAAKIMGEEDEFSDRLPGEETEET